jgi:hypothetical protein
MSALLTAVPLLSALFPQAFVAVLVYGALAASGAGGVLLLLLLARDRKNRRIW